MAQTDRAVLFGPMRLPFLILPPACVALGTATAVWWENQMTGDLVFGIPQLPILDQENRPLENQELQPDLIVDNPPEAAAQGRDLPLEAAIDSLLAGLDDN